MSRAHCPVLYVRGDREPRDLYPAERFAELAKGTVTVKIVAECDHFYVGREAEVSSLVSGWLASLAKR
jgi:alpha/beta superfamily hydrolase